MPKPPIWQSDPITAEFDCDDLDGTVRLTLALSVASCEFVPPPATDGNILLESADILLAENGDRLRLE